MPRRGLTLMELLVVLAILAALATVAVRSTAQIRRQTRYDSAKRGLREIEEAVVGPAGLRGGDGAAMAAGFIADVGRLPIAVGSDPDTALAELWSNPSAIPAYALRPAPSDPEVLVEGGWRGPYLRLGIGESRLRDGWGRAFDLLRPDGGPAGAGEPVAAIRSRGSDGQVGIADGADEYAADLELALSRGSATVSGQVYQWDASAGALRDPDAPVTVRLFLPDPAAPGGVSERSVTLTAAPFRYVFADVPIGPRMIRAYGPSRRSVPVRFAVTPSGSGPNLTIP